ncbi:hypothetical protein N9L51_04110 [Gammaproteobacteria bacterium]|nr:hypothetical protein [Gammaproteobacteria bacterium]
MKKIFFLSLTLLFFIPEILADKRAPRGECYISIGYVNDRAGVAEFAKNSFIKPENFELFEREDKKVYLTLGKIDENLFKKLQSQNKTYDFNCSRGKGYEERLGLNSDFQIIGGNKINIVSAEQFISVVSSIEIEKQRLVDLEVEKQVQARMAALEKERVAKEAAEKERQRLAELERKRKAEEEAEKERQRLAELERKRKAEEEAEKERERLALIERQRKEQEAMEMEKQRLADLEKQKKEKAKLDELNKEALSLGFANIEEMKFANYYETSGPGKIETVVFCGNQKEGYEVLLSGEERFDFYIYDITGREGFLDFGKESHSVGAIVVPIKNGLADHTAISTYYLKTNLEYYFLESTFSGYLNWYEHGNGGSIGHRAPNYKLFRDGSGLEILPDWSYINKYIIYPHPSSYFGDLIKPCSPMQNIDGNELAAKRLGGFSKFMEAKYNKIIDEKNKKEAALKAKSKF